MNKFLVLPVAIIFLFTAIATAYAQSASVTATVQVNPLQINISAPAIINPDQWFEIEVQVTNHGSVTLSRTRTILNTSRKLIVRGKRKRIGNLAPSSTQILIYTAKANVPGIFLAHAEATAQLQGNQLSDTDTILITTNNSFRARLRKLIFDSLLLLE